MSRYDEGSDKPLGWAKDDNAKGGETKGDKWDKDWMVEGEVTSRRKHKVSKEEVEKAKDEHVSLNWDDVFPKKPIDRLRWLDKAFRAAHAGRIKCSLLFNIVAHRKFIEGFKGSLATDCLNLIRGNLKVFSSKQQKQLTSDNFELFRKYAPINVLDSSDDEADAPPLPPPPKVVIEPKDKKRKGQGPKRKHESDSDGRDSNDDLETKKQKVLRKGIERRVDPADQEAYTLDEFIEQYGGSNDKPPVEWINSGHTSFIFKT